MVMYSGLNGESALLVPVMREVYPPAVALADARTTP
jgi:hypothetical protein